MMAELPNFEFPTILYHTFEVEKIFCELKRIYAPISFPEVAMSIERLVAFLYEPLVVPKSSPM